MDYGTWITALSADPKWKPEVDSDWLEEQLHVFSKLEILRNNKGLIDATEMLKVQKAKDMNIVRLISFLYQCNRSSLIPSQTKSPRLAAFTPLVLYANRLYNDIKYDEWDKASPHLKYFIGKALEPTLKLVEPITLSHDKVIELRKDALNGNPIDGYRIKKFKYNNRTYSSMNLIGRMLLQTWIANASLRNTDSMILDPFNWENVPEEVDEVGIQGGDMWDII